MSDSNNDRKQSDSLLTGILSSVAVVLISVVLYLFTAKYTDKLAENLPWPAAYFLSASVLSVVGLCISIILIVNIYQAKRAFESERRRLESRIEDLDKISSNIPEHVNTIIQNIVKELDVKRQMDSLATQLNEAVMHLNASIKSVEMLSGHQSGEGSGEIWDVAQAMDYEKRLTNHSDVIVISPDVRIEFSPARAAHSFSSVVLENINDKDISYTYILRPDQDKINERLHRDIYDQLPESKRNKLIIREMIVSGSSEFHNFANAMCSFTVTIYTDAYTNKVTVLLVAPGFDPPFAIVVPDADGSRIRKDIREYTKRLQ